MLLILQTVCALALQSSTPCTAELVSSVATVQAGKPFWVAVRLRPEEGWHTYWRNPGDSGMATTVAWHLPPGWQADPIAWPIPERLEAAGLVSYGYEGETLLPIRLTPPAKASGKTVDLSALASWLVCKETCVAGSQNLKLTLALGPKEKANPLWGPKIGDLLAQAPKPFQGSGVAQLAGSVIHLQLTGANLPASFAFYAHDDLVDAEATQAMQPVPGGATIDLKLSQFASGKPKRLQGLLVAPPGEKWPNGVRAVSIDLPIQS